VDLSHLQHVKILGGEPFITPNFEKFIDYLIERADPTQICIEIATNGTKIPKKSVVKKLNKFRLLNINISLDSYSKANDYQRVGSSYLTTFNNTKIYETLFKRAEFIFHSVTSILTANYLSETMNFLHEEHNYYVSADFVRYPEHLSLLHAPPEYIEWVLKHNTTHPRAEKLLKSFTSKSVYNEIHWKAFLSITAKLDVFYKTKLEDYNKPLFDFLKLHKYIGDAT
jgi:sulfatase maturation enzyme AslB (radical SAM superfamily)